MALLVLFGAYAGYSWYSEFYSVSETSGTGGVVSMIGATVLVLGFLVIAYLIGVATPKTCDFLIDMDSELKKVIWPDVQPVFDPKAEAWGATYVVIITVIVLTVFIYAVDIFLTFAVQDGLLSWLFS
jgi:preprotein translocase subunit SecE